MSSSIPCITSVFLDSKDSLRSLVNRDLGTTENSYWPMYFSRFSSGLFLDAVKNYTNSHVTEIKFQVFILRRFLYYEIHNYLMITLKIGKAICHVCDVKNSNRAFRQ